MNRLQIFNSTDGNQIMIYEGKRYEMVPHGHCNGCYFEFKADCPTYSGNDYDEPLCNTSYGDVIFKEIKE